MLQTSETGFKSCVQSTGHGGIGHDTHSLCAWLCASNLLISVESRSVTGNPAFRLLMWPSGGRQM